VLSFPRFPLVAKPRPVETHTDKEDRTSLRWKLLVITSLLATITGAGLYSAITYLIFVSSDLPGKAMLPAGAAFLLPVASVTYATIFVYRHTARRRKLQAVLTALLSLFLIIAALFATRVIIIRKTPTPQLLTY
jgi:hypothetical protein